MREPIQVRRPSESQMMALRNEKRTSLVYEHLLTTKGLGEAERWIDALELGSPSLDPLHVAAAKSSQAGGWTLTYSAQSEQIARK